MKAVIPAAGLGTRFLPRMRNLTRKPGARSVRSPGAMDANKLISY